MKAEKDAEIAQLKAETATLMARADQADARAEKAAAESSQLKTFLCSQFPAAPMCHQ